MLTNAVDGLHKGPWTVLWCAPERLWTDLFGNREPPEAMERHVYVGPCLTPDQHTLAIEATRRETVEACISAIRTSDAGAMTIPVGNLPEAIRAVTSSTKSAAIQAVQALPIDNADTLAAQIAAERALGREEGLKEAADACLTRQPIIEEIFRKRKPGHPWVSLIRREPAESAALILALLNPSRDGGE